MDTKERNSIRELEAHYDAVCRRLNAQNGYINELVEQVNKLQTKVEFWAFTAAFFIFTTVVAGAYILKW